MTPRQTTSEGGRMASIKTVSKAEGGAEKFLMAPIIVLILAQMGLSLIHI